MEICFDKLKNIDIPAGWTEKALALPERIPEKRHFGIRPFYLSASAACLALVVAVAVTVWLLPTGEKPSVMPVFVTEPCGSTAQQTVEAATEKLSSGIASEPTEKSSMGHFASEPAEELVTEPLPFVTAKPSTEPVTEAEETALYVTEPLIASDTTAPTYKPVFPNGCTLVAEFSADRLTEGGSVYCRMLDESGLQLGEPDSYSEQHLSELTVSGERVRATYRPLEAGLELEEGEAYTIVFYTDDGAVLVQSVPMRLFDDIVIIMRG